MRLRGPGYDEWPVATPLPVGGEAYPRSPGSDGVDRSPLRIISLTATGSTNVPQHGWLELAGQFTVGWTYQPSGDGAVGSVPLVPGALLPAPRSGRFVVDAAGAGTVVLICWPASVGDSFAYGRGAAPAGSSVSSPKSSATRTVVDGRSAPAIAGTALVTAAPTATLLVVVADQANANPVFLADTQAKAALLGAAGGGTPVYPVGIREIPVASGASFFAASSTGTEILYVERQT